MSSIELIQGHSSPTRYIFFDLAVFEAIRGVYLFFFFCVKLSTIYNRSTSSGFFFSPGIKSQQYLRGEDLEQEEAGPQAASGGGAGVEKGRLKVLPAPEAVALLLLS